MIFFIALAILITFAKGELTGEDAKKAAAALYSLSADATEGDLILTPKQRAGLKHRIIWNDHYPLWPNGVVPYKVHSSLQNLKSEIDRAAAHINNMTGGCIKYTPQSNQENFVHLWKGTGCNSAAGMKGGEQWLSLGDGCQYFGTAVHEMMHALGFGHEQNRPDRDSYIRVNWNNILDGFAGSFEKGAVGTGIAYTDFDFDSIMLYGNTAFTKNGQYTMEDLTGKRRLLNPYDRSSMSVWDVYNIKRLYNCFSG